jgi:hypothetical protein
MKNGDMMPEANQLAGDIGSDETCSADDQDAHRNVANVLRCRSLQARRAGTRNPPDRHIVYLC